MRKTILAGFILIALSLSFGTANAGFSVLYDWLLKPVAEPQVGSTIGYSFWKSTTTDQYGNTINAIETVDNKDLYLDANASTTGSFAFEAITGSTQCLQIDTNGLVSGFGSACGGTPIQNWSWGADSSYITPSSTVGILINASSTIQGGLRVDGNVTTTQAFYGDYWISATGNSMNVQPTGDTDDFFSFKTPSDRPTIKVEGGDRIYIESSDSDEVGIEYRKDASHSGAIIYYKTENLFGLTSQDSMVFKVCGDYDDYVTICSANNIPELSVASSTAFKINAGGTNSLLLNDAGGNVGIGLTSPTSTLAVLGDTVLTGNATTTGALSVGADLTIGGKIDDNVIYIGEHWMYVDTSNITDGFNIGGEASTTAVAFSANDHSYNAFFDISQQTASRTYTFPDQTGTLMLADYTGNATTTGWFYIGQDLTVNGTINGNVTGDLTGNASTATALVADGANCAAGSYPLGVDASGAVQSCTDATTEINSVVNGLGGTNLTCSGQSCNVDDKFLKNDANDTMVGVLTLDGLTLGENENITLGSFTLDHDGTDFVFNDSISIAGSASSTSYNVNGLFTISDTGRATTTAVFDITDGTNGIRFTAGATSTIEAY